ncbi:basic proline-rich protein-like [Phoca vitulina]|uniref:basic proline-rich protein-like n=1 Tax=Phoca vitulina TaxID=9720 RepID=UPI001395CF3A|nr:basic proline-rich protein-like [Phoca vitulina]
MKRVSHRVLSPRQLKEASTCSDGAARNFSASSGGTRRHGPGRSKHKSAPPARQVRGPGPGGRAARAGPGRGYAGEGAPPLPGPSAGSRQPAALSAPEGRTRLRSPQIHPRPPPSPSPRGSPSSRQGRPRQVLGGAAPARGANLGGECGGGRGPSAASQARSVPTPRPPPPPPPPPLLARQRAGRRGKESERETAPAAAWPVPAPRPPSPCRRERAGSAGPLGSGPIGRGGPRGPGPVPPPRATPPPSNRRRRRPVTPPATPPAPRPQATPACPRSSQLLDEKLKKALASKHLRLDDEEEYKMVHRKVVNSKSSMIYHYCCIP